MLGGENGIIKILFHNLDVSKYSIKFSVGFSWRIFYINWFSNPILIVGSDDWLMDKNVGGAAVGARKGYMKVL